MTVSLCEDTPKDAKNLLEQISGLLLPDDLIRSFSSGLDLIAAVEHGYQPDLVFLDIRMPGAEGIEIAQSLKGAYGKAEVVYITNYIEYAYPAYQTRPITFLLKPPASGELTDIIAEVRHKLITGEPRLEIHSMSATHYIPHSRIVYIETGLKPNILKVYTPNETYSMYGTLKELQDDLGREFLRVNISTLINRKFIDQIKGKTVTLADDLVTVSVSRKYWAVFIGALK